MWKARIMFFRDVTEVIRYSEKVDLYTIMYYQKGARAFVFAQFFLEAQIKFKF